jgi:hypothetical protein
MVPGGLPHRARCFSFLEAQKLLRSNVLPGTSGFQNTFFFNEKRDPVRIPVRSIL